jgi:hypothetical protein
MIGLILSKLARLDLILTENRGDGSRKSFREALRSSLFDQSQGAILTFILTLSHWEARLCPEHLILKGEYETGAGEGNRTLISIHP